METKLISFEIKIVFDNSVMNDGFLSGYGFSALVYNYYTENYILFDTGQNQDVLLHNIKKLNIDISEIKKVVISHNHIENTGGLLGIYEINPHIDIYIPAESYILYKRKYKESNVYGVSESIEIDKNVFSTGQLGNYLKEQALILKTEYNELIILVGCSHPGLEEIINSIREYKKSIKAVIGGFHNFRKYTYLEGIDIIGPCYCTEHTDEIQKRYPEQFTEICVGTSLTF